MDYKILKSFFIELEKLAFNPEDARALLKSTKQYNIRAGNRSYMGYGALPSKKQLNISLKNDIKNFVSENPSISPTKVEYGFNKLVESNPLVNWASKKQKILSQEHGDSTNWLRNSADKNLQRSGFNIKTPEEHMMMDAIFKGHEQSELEALRKPKKIGIASHASPEVILKEHNMLATMPENLKNNIQPVFNIMRGHNWGNEKNILSKATNGKFEYGETPRLSRHARKHITELYNKSKYFKLNNKKQNMFRDAYIRDIPFTKKEKILNKIKNFFL